MSEKRFIVESVMITNDCNEDKSRIVKVITDKEELYSYEDLYEVAELLNKQQELIEELRLQEKDKGVPVFVVREGKNPIALFFNEQRASLYCQENMAHLTYQQEKWCRVE